MSKLPAKQEVDESVLEAYADDIDDNDYVFVLCKGAEKEKSL